MSILETKRTDSNTSENHLNYCHMEKGGSKYQPRPLPAALFQHIVLISYESRDMSSVKSKSLTKAGPLHLV